MSPQHTQPESPVLAGWRDFLATHPEVRGKSEAELAEAELVFRAGWEALDAEAQTRLVKEQVGTLLESFEVIDYERELAEGA